VVARRTEPLAGTWLAAFHFNVLFGPRGTALGCFPELTEIKPADRAVVKLTHCMDNFVFKCPRTGMNVQHRLADEPAAGDPHGAYETVLCPACGGLHFIHRSSRKLLGEQNE
jgi:hypothetical protein